MKHFRATIELDWDNQNASVIHLKAVLEGIFKYTNWPKLQATKIEVEQINEKTNEK